MHILIDSKSLSRNCVNDPNLLDFLHYSSHDCFDIKRTPVKTGLAIIDSIPQFQSNFETIRNENLMRSIMNKVANCRRDIFKYLDIENMTKEIFQKQTITIDEWKTTQNIFAHACSYHDRESSIYITRDQTILQRQNWFLEYLSGKPINIVTIEEGKEVMDLFAKNLGYYIIAPGMRADMEYYYWLSFISKLSNYYCLPMMYATFESNTAPLGALAQRFKFILKCVDKMGIDYYRGYDIDALDEIRFYFNYFIILMTAIFDSLAYETKTKHSISFQGDDNPNRTSLNNTSKGFLKEIERKNSNLYNHIKLHEKFISMIYKLRNPIVHGNFRAPDNYHVIFESLIQINTDIAHILSSLEEHPKRDPHSEWGRIERAEDNYISMYIFSKRATYHLINFVNLYLEKLGVPNYKIEPVGYDEQLSQIFRKKS